MEVFSPLKQALALKIVLASRTGLSMRNFSLSYGKRFSPDAFTFCMQGLTNFKHLVFKDIEMEQKLIIHT